MKITVLIKTADHIFGTGTELFGDIGETELFQQDFLQGGFCGDGIEQELPPAFGFISAGFRFFGFQHSVQVFLVIFPVGIEHVVVRTEIPFIFGKGIGKLFFIGSIRGNFIDFEDGVLSHFSRNAVFQFHDRQSQQRQGCQLLGCQRLGLFQFLLL